MQPLVTPEQRARLAGRHAMMIGLASAGGIVFALCAAVALVALAAGGGSREIEPWQAGGAVLIVVLGALLMAAIARKSRRLRDRWRGASSAPSVRVNAVVDRFSTGKYHDDVGLRLSDGEVWAVEVVKDWRRCRRGDQVLVEIHPAADGGCVGAFLVGRTDAVCWFSADRPPRRLAATSTG